MKLEYIPEKKFMLEALSLAKEAAIEGEVPVGAVIVKDGEIIARGRNRREQKQNALLHAEIEAISIACERLKNWRLSGCEIYVSLEPCSMCSGAIANARLDRAVFAAYDNESGFCGSVADIIELSPQCTTKIFRGFMEETATKILKDFFDKIR